MKLMIIGATGRTGGELVKEALANNNEVVAYTRSPRKMTSVPKLKIIEGQLNDVDSLTKALNGCTAVLVALGNPMSNSSGNLFSFAIPNIIEAMDEANVKRIVSLSALGVGDTYKNSRYPYRLGAKTFLKGNFADHAAGESKLIDSDLDWTTIHPGPLFNGNKTPKPLVRNVNSGFKMPGAPRTYRSDVAQVMLNAIGESRTYGQKLIMCSKQDKN